MRNSIVQYVLSTLLIGIPEMTFIFMVSLALLKSITNLRISRFTVSALVLTSAIFLNIPEIISMDRYLALGLAALTVIASVQLASRKAAWKVLFAALGGISAFVLTELAFGVTAFNALNLTDEMVVGNVFIAFGGSSVERVMQFALLYIFSLDQMKRLFSPRAESINVFGTIRHSLFYRRCFILSFLFAILWNGIIAYICTTYTVLRNIPFTFSVMFLILAMVISIVPILVLVLQVYHSSVNIKAYLKFAARNIRINTADIYAAAIKAEDDKALRSVRNLQHIANKLDENTN
jgi:hypothetical protein